MKKTVFAIITLVLTAYTAEAQVYVGGSCGDIVLGIGGSACYWVDGVLHSIDGESVDAITVVGSTVYTAGTYRSRGSTYICRYWVNGTPFELPGCKFVNSICVANGNVYVTGETEDEWCYWVNGVRRPGPTDGRMDGRSFTVASGKVYTAGWYEVGDTPYACYWIDGVRKELPNSQDFIACGIEVVNGKVYVGATRLVSRNSFRACYWIDGVQTIIPEPGDLLNNAFSVFNGNVYMVGDTSYWVNGIRRDINAAMLQGYRYTVFRGKVYIAGGRGRTGQMGFTPCYWADGAFYDLYGSQVGQIAEINAIFVKE